MSALHLGSGGKQGTQSNPLFVSIVNGIAGMGSSVSKAGGGIFGGLLGMLGIGGGSSSAAPSVASGWGDTAWDDIPAFASGGQITGPFSRQERRG